MANQTLARIKDLVEKIPVTPILVAYLAYLGLEYHTFVNDAGSPLNLKKTELQSAEQELAKLRTRVKETSDFLKSLDLKRAEMRRLAQELEDTKASLTETVDVPAFMKQVLAEAQRVGLKVLSIKPGESSREEYYAQQNYDLTFRGVFIQFVGFLDRLSNLQKIVRAEDFEMKPITPAYGKFVELEGRIEVKTYRYLGSKADDLVRSGDPASGASPASPKGAGP